MKYYGEESMISDTLMEVSSDFSSIFCVDGFVIETTPSPTGNIYFRIMTGFPYYDDEDPADIKMTRISMLSPEYIKDKGDSWNLSEDEKEKLYNALGSNNLWNEIIEGWNNDADSINNLFSDINIKDRLSIIDIPDYTKLK